MPFFTPMVCFLLPHSYKIILNHVFHSIQFKIQVEMLYAHARVCMHTHACAHVHAYTRTEREREEGGATRVTDAVSAHGKRSVQWALCVTR